MAVRSKLPRKAYLYIVSLLILLALTSFACISQPSTNNSNTSNSTSETEGQDSTNASTPEPTSTPEMLYKTYKQDQYAEIDGLKISIDEIKDYTSPFKMVQPEAGNKYITIMVSVENISDKDKSYHVGNFKIKDKEGKDYWSNLLVKADPLLDFGYLQPKKKVRGNVVFEIPQTLKKSDLRLTYYDPMTMEETVVWELS